MCRILSFCGLRYQQICVYLLMFRFLMTGQRQGFRLFLVNNTWQVCTGPSELNYLIAKGKIIATYSLFLIVLIMTWCTFKAFDKNHGIYRSIEVLHEEISIVVFSPHHLIILQFLCSTGFLSLTNGSHSFVNYKANILEITIHIRRQRLSYTCPVPVSTHPSFKTKCYLAFMIFASSFFLSVL